MNTKSYKVTCLKCKGSNIALITEAEPGEFIINLDYDHRKHPDNINIVSGRYRKTMDFGWQCICGNDSRIAREEFKDIRELVIGGGEAAIQKITNSLRTTDAKKFSMVEA